MNSAPPPPPPPEHPAHALRQRQIGVVLAVLAGVAVLLVYQAFVGGDADGAAETPAGPPELAWPTPQHEAPLPLLVVLHGDDGRPERHRDAWRAACDAEGVALLVPTGRRGTGDEPARWLFSPAERERLLAELDRALADRRLDRDRVLLAGMQSGAEVAWALAAEHPARFAALALFHGSPGKRAERGLWAPDAGPRVALAATEPARERAEAAVAALRAAGVPTLLAVHNSGSWYPPAPSASLRAGSAGGEPLRELLRFLLDRPPRAGQPDGSPSASSGQARDGLGSAPGDGTAPADDGTSPAGAAEAAPGGPDAPADGGAPPAQGPSDR